MCLTLFLHWRLKIARIARNQLIGETFDKKGKQKQFFANFSLKKIEKVKYFRNRAILAMKVSLFWQNLVSFTAFELREWLEPSCSEIYSQIMYFVQNVRQKSLKFPAFEQRNWLETNYTYCQKVWIIQIWKTGYVVFGVTFAP